MTCKESCTHNINVVSWRSTLSCTVPFNCFEWHCDRSRAHVLFKFAAQRIPVFRKRSLRRLPDRPPGFGFSTVAHTPFALPPPLPPPPPPPLPLPRELIFFFSPCLFRRSPRPPPSVRPSAAPPPPFSGRAISRAGCALDDAARDGDTIRMDLKVRVMALLT